MLAHLVKKGVFQRVSRSKQSSITKVKQSSITKEETSHKVETVEYFKRGFHRHRCSKAFAKAFASAKCFAKPLARRMVRKLKEKDDGGTTGGLSSAGTPHNNFCVHIAVHFRQGGGVEGG